MQIWAAHNILHNGGDPPFASKNDLYAAIDNSNMDNSNTDNSNIESPVSGSQSTRPYNTRLTNEAHPAKKFGLEKRTRDAVAAEASRKRAEKDEAVQRRQDAEEKEREITELHIRGLAALEDQLKAMRDLISNRVTVLHNADHQPDQAWNSSPEEDDEDIVMEDSAPIAEKLPAAPPKKSGAKVSKLSIISLSVVRIDVYSENQTN